MRVLYKNMFCAFIAVYAFMTPTLRLENGQRISLHGSGPPVIFSSGLFGLMPRRLYTSLFHLLKRDMTLVVLEDVAPVTSDVITQITNTLSVEKVGLLTHSSIYSEIINSKEVQAAVLCDPVVLPIFDMMKGGLVPPETEPEFPIMVIKAEKAYSFSGIPSMISPRLEGAHEITFMDVGHADILDDTWANMGPKMLPWMKGIDPPKTEFRRWSLDARSKIGGRRAEYRKDVANQIIQHLVNETAISV
jgi:hypothetical protein